jgi:bifunctional DNA-binding transcriptional regulator/antitoxin component of YhaV-PrlF toxin-antitoxin module
MEHGELLKVNITSYSSESYQEEMFLAKMARDGRLTIPKLTMEVLKLREEKNLTGAILEVTISPVGGSNNASPAESAEMKMLCKIKDIRKN